jgi:hypothetical protein
MAITRAQIPEQIDLFDEGGEVLSSLSPEDIIALYGAQTSAPITAADIQAQAAEMSGLFPQQKKQNIFDLASEVGAGLVAGASDPRGFGAGLTAGFTAFNERAQKIQNEKNKMQQQLAMLAYQQVEAKRKEQAEMSRDILEMQFDAALEGQEVDFGSSTLGKALGFIAQAERNPSLKMIPDPDNPAQMIPNPDYVIAVAIAKQDKTSVVQTETGAQSVTIPGIDVDSIFAKKKPITPAATVIENGVTYTFTGRYEGDKPIYKDPDGNEGVIQ